MGWRFGCTSVLWLNTATKITIESTVGALAFNTIMPKETAHAVTTPMVSKITPRETKIGHELSSTCRCFHPLYTDRVLWAKPKLSMNGTLWKGSSRGLSQKPEIFVIKAPVMTPSSKVLDGGTILHKARTVIWKAPCKTWKAWTQLSIDAIFWA